MRNINISPKAPKNQISNCIRYRSERVLSTKGIMLLVVWFQTVRWQPLVQNKYQKNQPNVIVYNHINRFHALLVTPKEVVLIFVFAIDIWTSHTPGLHNCYKQKLILSYFQHALKPCKCSKMYTRFADICTWNLVNLPMLGTSLAVTMTIIWIDKGKVLHLLMHWNSRETTSSMACI